MGDDMCKDWVAETKDGTNFLEKGGMGAVDTVFKNGAVLVMSLWDDHYANMLWLDSTYPVDQDAACRAGKGDPGTCRGSCAITTGVPADVEKDVPNATIQEVAHVMECLPLRLRCNCDMLFSPFLLFFLFLFALLQCACFVPQMLSAVVFILS